METKNQKICSNCRRKLDVGVDAIRINNGVIGIKDFVPLDETMLFCSDECIREYYDLGDLPKLQRRVP